MAIRLAAGTDERAELSSSNGRVSHVQADRGLDPDELDQVGGAEPSGFVRRAVGERRARDADGNDDGDHPDAHDDPISVPEPGVFPRVPALLPDMRAK